MWFVWFSIVNNTLVSNLLRFLVKQLSSLLVWNHFVSSSSQFRLEMTSHVRLKIGVFGELYSWIFSYRKRGRLWVALQWLLVMLLFQCLKNTTIAQKTCWSFEIFCKCEMMWNALTDTDDSIANIPRQTRAIVATVQTTGISALTTLVSTQARHILISTIVVHWKKLSNVKRGCFFF